MLINRLFGVQLRNMYLYNSVIVLNARTIAVLVDLLSGAQNYLMIVVDILLIQ